MEGFKICTSSRKAKKERRKVFALKIELETPGRRTLFALEWRVFDHSVTKELGSLQLDYQILQPDSHPT